MNGEGTQNSPYEITTVEELYTACETSGTYAKLMNDLDFSTYTHNYSKELLKTLNFNFTEFDGNGYAFKNVVTSGGTFIELGTGMTFSVILQNLRIEALIFEGIVTNGDNYFINNYSNLTVKIINCEFIIKKMSFIGSANNSYAILRTSFSSRTSSTCYLTDCIMSLDQYFISGISNVPRDSTLFASISKDLYSYITNCSFKLNLHLLDNVVLQNNYKISLVSSSAEFRNNCFFVNIYNDYNNNNYLFFSTSVLRLYNNSLVLKNKGSFPLTCFQFTSNNYFYEPFVYDNEVCGETVINISGGTSNLLYGLTTAQMKDLDYLKSINFLAYKEE